MVEVRVILFFLDDLHFLSHVLRVGVAEKVAVSWFSKPVIASFQLVVIILIVVSFALLFYKSISVGAFASQGEIATSVSVSWFDILVISSVTWELRRVGSELSSRPIAMQKIFRMGSLELISLCTNIPLPVDTIDVEMRTFQPIILFVMVDLIGNHMLLVEASLINRIFG